MRSVVFILLAACSTSTTDNFQNPPPGPPDTCAAIASLPGCDHGSLSFACTAGRPDDGDTNLVCSDGAPGGDSSALYCCAPYAQQASECVPDTTLPGCTGAAMGFACSGPTAPSDADPTIACSAPIAGSDGEQRYCCNTAAIPATCAVDASVACGGIAIGYACAGADAPSAGDAALACAPGSAGGSGATEYCCIPFASDASTCSEARDVGCASGDYSFACAEGVTPAQVANDLTCAPHGGTSPGYCCML